jgi:para-aminobenzoate synthetase component 1
MDWVVGFVDCPGLIFLDSALRHESLGRYSFIAADPLHRLETRGTLTTLDGAAVEGGPFAAIADLLARHPLDQIPGLPPFQTGLAGQFGYGLRHHVESLPAHARSDHGFPDLELGWYDVVVAVDHRDHRAFVFASGARAEARTQWALGRLQGRAGFGLPDWEIEPAPDLSAEQYRRAVRRAIDYIEAGDIYQANITQRFQAELPRGFERPGLERLALYDELRRQNPATFAAFVDFGATALLSSSPERFLKVEDGAVETRPIKGTRPRGGNPVQDAALGRELLESEKDRAENLMIADLLRNDVGRVARLGSVKVPVLIGLESYATVHHLVSVVTAALDDGKTAVDLLQAAFPGGSVTGAPKIRAMEIIAELEPTERGPYCGAIGYLSAGGAMDTNIVIRTLLIAGDRLSFQVGGGIVADSDPQAEWQESLTKAKALIQTLAGRGRRAAKKRA